MGLHDTYFQACLKELNIIIYVKHITQHLTESKLKRLLLLAAVASGLIDKTNVLVVTDFNRKLRTYKISILGSLL